MNVSAWDEMEQGIETEIVDGQVRAEQEGGFVVDNDSKAEWAIRKIGLIRAEAKRIADVCREAIAVYVRKTTEAEDEAAKKTAWLENQLRAYANTVTMKATDTQAKYKLPSGTLKVKFGGVKYERNNDLILPWLRENMVALVKTKEDVDWEGLKKITTIAGSGVVTTDGEQVPGVTVVQKPDEFVVEVG